MKATNFIHEISINDFAVHFSGLCMDTGGYCADFKTRHFKTLLGAQKHKQKIEKKYDMTNFNFMKALGH